MNPQDNSSSIEEEKRKLIGRKKRLRTLLRIRLETHDEGVKFWKDIRINKRIIKSSAFLQAETIMFYASTPTEVDTDKMIEVALRMGKRVALPSIETKNTTLRPYKINSPDELVAGKYGIRSPPKTDEIMVSELDLIIVPGLAFDRRGSRLGQGMGYYDRFLSQIPSSCTVVGVCYDMQLFPKLPTNMLDIPVHQVVTEWDYHCFNDKFCKD